LLLIWADSGPSHIDLLGCVIIEYVEPRRKKKEKKKEKEKK
jgi:hypothetical protein